MREIKFRVWDCIDNKFREVIGFDYNCGGIKRNTIQAWNEDIEVIEHYEDAEVQQYIGLKDVDGIEIYEGDIVQCNENHEDLHEVKFGKFPLRDLDTDEIAEFVTGWYFVILENDKLSNIAPFCYPVALNDYWINKLKIKVVGNIEQNKELIGEVTK